MAACFAPRPTLLVMADDAAGSTLRDLFGQRGFVVVTVDSFAALESYLAQAVLAPAAAVIDFRHDDVAAAARTLREQHPGVVLVGIVTGHDVTSIQDALDAAFEPPVDRARLFVRVVELVAARKKGHPANKITGVVGVIRGNRLFHRALDLLHEAVPPVNAGAILERALFDIGTTPTSVDPADLAAILASGRLHDALAPFSDGHAIHHALLMLSTLLDSRLGPEDPCIPVRIDADSSADITARTCG